MARIQYDWWKYAAAFVLVLLCVGQALAQAAKVRLKKAVPLASRSAEVGTQETTGLPIALPGAVVYDKAGNLYISDIADHVIRKLDTSGILTTVVGTGEQGFAGDGGAATSAQLDSPAGLAIDDSGNLYVSDTHNQRIRKVSNGVITTIAGTGTTGFSGDGGAAIQASLSLPGAIAVDASGNVYFADTNNHRIRRIAASDGVITTIAGNGVQAYSGDGGAATEASLDSPNGLAVDSAGNVYVSDSHNDRVRRIDLQGIITTIAGDGKTGFSGDGTSSTAASLARPMGLAVDAQGQVYVADSNNQRIRVISKGVITTVAGSGEQGFSGDSGVATSASLNTPLAVAVNPAGEVAVADTQNQAVRRTESGIVNTTAGGGPANTPTLQLSGSPGSVYGSGSSITARILNGSAPTGSVILKEGTSVIASASLSGGTATFSAAGLGAGVHNLVASYSGDGSNPSAVSGLYVLTINKANAAIALQTSASSVLLKDNLVLTARLASSTTGTPTGTVRFLEGNTPLGSATIDNTGNATLPLSTLPAGQHSITAVYAGDSNFAGITSAVQSTTVQDFQFSVSGGTASVTQGATASYSVQLTPTNGSTFPATVTLALAGLPSGATYTISPSSIAAGSGANTVTVTVQTARLNASSTHSPAGRFVSMAVVFGILPVPLFGARHRSLQQRRKLAVLAMLVLTLLVVAGMSGCGAETGFLGQQQKNYTLTLTGTSGALQHSATLNLTVQ